QGGGDVGRVSLHDLVHDYCLRRAQLEFGKPAFLHDLLLAAYRQQGPGRLLQGPMGLTKSGTWHALAPDGYIHARLGWHLEKAGDDLGLHALLKEETPEGRNRWHATTDRLGRPVIFIDDVRRAMEWTKRPGLRLRYALVLASLNSAARAVSATTLEALVRAGSWTFEQALAYARLKPERTSKADALAALL